MSVLGLIKVNWERFFKVNKGVLIQRDFRVDIFRNFFNRFKRYDNESC